jgi:eukaryotic-like serine/threonine-protein kinase
MSGPLDDPTRVPKAPIGPKPSARFEAVEFAPEPPSGETCAIVPDPPAAPSPPPESGPVDKRGRSHEGGTFVLNKSFAIPSDESFQPDPNQGTIAIPDEFGNLPAPIGQGSAVPFHEIRTIAVGPDGKSLPPSDSEPGDGQPRVRGYEIVSELGRGGMGVVYKAKQKGLNRLVAIKMVLGGEHVGEIGLARFKTEGEAVASIQHPNIVQIYEVGDQNGLPYFSLEYIDGGSLQQRIDGKPQAIRDAARIIHQLALGMQSVHDRGVIHRDLKPANVLMTMQGTPKITDFGLAKRVESDSKQTRTGSLMGTPSYMAPEQARGDTYAISPLSDLYSLGAILYEMLTGRPPFQGATLLDTMEQVRSQEPVPPTRLQPKIPRDLETICLKCLQKLPSQRYPNMAALADDLKSFLDEKPIKARPVGRLEHAWRWVKRNPRVATLSASIVALGLLLLATATTVLIRSIQENQTIAKVREVTLAQIEGGKDAILKGDYRQAKARLANTNPFLAQTPALADVREDLDVLRSQVDTFAKFRELLDQVRVGGLLEGEARRGKARQDCQELVQFYEQIKSKKGEARFGLPVLSTIQQQLFNEDVFDAFLIAAQTEYEFGSAAKDQAKLEESGRRAISWLDQAESLLPPTRALYVWRQGIKEKIGDLKEAQEDKVKGEAIVPNSPVDHFWHGYAERLRGELFRKNKDLAKASESFRNAKTEYAKFLQARPENDWGYLEWAKCQGLLGNPSDALVGFTACIQLRDENAWPYHNRATCHVALKEYEDAVADETSAIKRDPDYLSAYTGRAKSYLALGRIPLAVADFDRVLRADPANAEILFQRANAYFALKNYAKARDDYSALIPLLPRPFVPYRSRAKVQYLLKNFDASIADWTKVAGLLPKDAESRYNIGVLQMGLRRYDQALQALENCLAIDPDHALAYFARAQIRRFQGDDPGALKDIDRVVQTLDSAKLDAATKAYYLNERVDYYRHVGRLDDSEKDARRSIALDPKQVDAYVALALLEKRRGKPDAASEWYDKMLASNPDSAEVHLRRAEFFRDLGRWDQALGEAEQVAKLDAERGPTLAGLVRAEILAARGEAGPAVEQAESLLRSTPNPNGPILYAGACVWSLASKAAAASGDPSKALALADRSAKLLGDALSLGFHDFNYQEKSRMIEDPALAAILDRPDVSRLFIARP